MKSSGHIYVIDDDQSIRDSLSIALRDSGYEVMNFSGAIDFLDRAVVIGPAVILLDMQMPDLTGLELQERLNKMGRSTPIIFISGQSHPKQIVESFRKGAINFIFKPFNLGELVEAVRAAIDADSSKEYSNARSDKIKDLYASLTPREKDVCDLLVKGFLSKDVADTLNISSATVKIHKSRVMKKMRVSSMQLLVSCYIQSGIGI